MSTEEARNSIGKMVMSKDPGYMLIKDLPWHGPYRLLKVTKCGQAILETKEDQRVRTSHLRAHE